MIEYIVLLFLVEILFLFLSIFIFHKSEVMFVMKMFMLVNMIIIMFFGAKAFFIGGYLLNYTNVCFSFVVFCQIYFMKMYPIDVAQKNIVEMLFCLALIFVISNIINIAPSSAAFSDIHEAISVLVNNINNVAVASFVSFSTVQSIAVVLYNKVNISSPVYMYLTLSVVMQMLDTIIFFMIAFNGMLSLGLLLNFLLKIGIDLLLLPFFLFYSKKRIPER